MSKPNLFSYIGYSLLEVFYPNQCVVCQTTLNHNEVHLCLNCRYDLPKIPNHGIQSDQLQKLFWGRVEVEKVYTLFNYQKGNSSRHILHQIKYKGAQKMGVHFGKELGQKMAQLNPHFDLIIPVPLHPKKRQIRGYNQSDLIAKGVSEILDVEYDTKHLKRSQFNASQTRFSKYDRWTNVNRIFKVKQSQKLIGKHILLVDDVLTTGATIEACVQTLKSIESVKISVATLAARV